MKIAGAFEVTWTDYHRKPKAKPNPEYPNGIDLDCAHNSERSCTASLPYPAAGLGHYNVVCVTCGIRLLVTTAGRSDDPKSIKVACKAGS